LSTSQICNADLADLFEHTLEFLKELIAQAFLAFDIPDTGIVRFLLNGAVVGETHELQRLDAVKIEMNIASLG
jgi:hypothetical protein